MKYFLILCFCVALIGICNAAEAQDPTAYLCIPTAATGFALDSSGNWKVTEFNVEGTKYLLNKKAGSWYWNEYGEDMTGEYNRCDAFDEATFMMCNYFGNHVLFNKNSLRFQNFHPFGYVTSIVHLDKEKKYRYTPVIEIGTCSPFLLL